MHLNIVAAVEKIGRQTEPATGAESSIPPFAGSQTTGVRSWRNIAYHQTIDNCWRILE